MKNKQFIPHKTDIKCKYDECQALSIILIYIKV